MLALLRKLPRQLEQAEVFHRDGLTGGECRGRNALVVGVGNIGGEIADIAKALGMNVKGVDIVPDKKGLKYVSLEDGIPWAQAILCALPLTDETRGLLSYEQLKRPKTRPVLVNVGRGETTPLEDLSRLMEEKVLGGVALDVYPDEDTLAENLRALVEEHPSVQAFYRLKSFPNVLCTPHNAFNTEEALLEKCRQTIRSVEMFLGEGRFPREVKG